MPGNNCLVCASNDGEFMDVKEHPELKNKAKNCRLDEVWEDSKTTKVCHKCAFELDQCNVFVERVKKASRIQNAKIDSCVLCLNTQNNDVYLFDLSKQKNGVNGLIQRLQDQFSDELKDRELKKQHICLSCRYCVDLLADLKTLLDEVPSKLRSVFNDGIDPADLPKTKTIIASRKTTYAQSSSLHLNTPSDTDSDTSIIMGSKKKVNKTSKSSKSSKKCGECKTPLADDADTYKLFKAKKILCKECWLRTDFNKTTSKKHKKVNHTKTPLCSVVLKDLYQTRHNDEYTITEDAEGNTIFKLTTNEISRKLHQKSETTKPVKSKARRRIDSDDSLDEEDKPAEASETTKQKENSEHSEHERDITVEPPASPKQRRDSEQSEQEENASTKSSKTARRRRSSELSVQEKETSAKPSRTTRRRKDSEVSVQEKETSAKPSRTTRDKTDSEVSEQEEETSTKRSKTTGNRKDSEQSVQESIDSKPRATRRRKDSEQSLQEVVESRPVRSTRRRNESEQSIQEDIKVKPVRSRNRKISEQSVESVEVKTSSRSKRKDSERSDVEEVEIDIDSDNGPSNKRAKKSNAKAQKQSAKRKRGRSSSIESTDSVRKSARNAKKNAKPLEEIIEIDDDLSDTDKVEKDLTRTKRNRGEIQVSYDERSDAESDGDLSDTDKVEKELTRSKRKRGEIQVSYDEHSDAESDKVLSKKNSPASSRESTPKRKSPLPTPKETEVSEIIETETKTNEMQSSRKNIESSESEEIDILKSTDEESKHDDSLELRNASKVISDVEIESEHDVSDKSTEKMNVSTSIAVDDSQSQNDIKENAQSDAKEKSVDREQPETIKDNLKEKSVDNNVVEPEDINDDDINISKEKSDTDDQDMSDDEKEIKSASKKKASKKNARKSKSTVGKKSRKSRVKSRDEIPADLSDSEQVKPAKETIVSTFTCKVCEKVFDSKYQGLQHEITHAKFLKVSLKRVPIPEKSKSEVNNKLDEAMDVDEDTEAVNGNGNEDVEMTEIKTKEPANQAIDFDKIETVNENEQEESDKATEQNDSESEITPNKRGRRASRRQSSRVIEEKREKKTRGRRKTSHDIPEPEVTTAVIEAEPDKIAEAVKETLNDMAELQERIRDESASKDQEPQDKEMTIGNEEKESENTETNEQEVISNDEPEVKTVEPEPEVETVEPEPEVETVEPEPEVETIVHEPEVETVTHDVESGSETEVAPTQNADERSHEIETHDIADDSSRDEVICDSNAESRDADPEEPEHPIVNLDDEASGDVFDVESEAKKHSEESEVEITEVEDVEAVSETVEPDDVVECEQVDLTEKDDAEDAQKSNDDDDDDNDIQEIVQETSRNVHEDENTVDSVTEINVTSAAEPTVENDAENPKQIDDTDNTTEEDEPLAQESLEDLLQRKGLQVVDELAESVTDGDDESEKEVNTSSDKDSTPKKNNDNENKTSDAECTEIVEVSNNKTPSKKSVVGEVQITQDVDVVEEVVNDDDDEVHPRNDVVEEVQVESNNVSFNFPKLY